LRYLFCVEFVLSAAAIRGLATQAAPVFAQRRQQLRAEHYIAVFSALST